MKLKGVTILVNYPDDEVEAAVPQEMTLGQLYVYLGKLVETEREMTSFVITAVVDRAQRSV